MEELRFDGRVAIITGVGNTAGLGFAYAKLLGKRGTKIVATDIKIDDEVIEEIKNMGIEAIFEQADITKMPDVQKVVDSAVETFGKVDILINNAGACKNVTLDKEEESLFDFILKVNTYGSRNFCKAVLPIMMEQKYGRIINTTSSAGMYGLQECFAYSAAKGAVYGMTRSLAHWGKEYGIKVNAIAPSAATGMALSSAGMDEAIINIMKSAMPTDAVAPAVAILAHESCELTGRVLESAGGGTGEIFVGTTLGVISKENSPEFILENWDKMLDKNTYGIVDDIFAPDSVPLQRLAMLG